MTKKDCWATIFICTVLPASIDPFAAAIGQDNTVVWLQIDLKKAAAGCGESRYGATVDVSATE